MEGIHTNTPAISASRCMVPQDALFPCRKTLLDALSVVRQCGFLEIDTVLLAHVTPLLPKTTFACCPGAVDNCFPLVAKTTASACVANCISWSREGGAALSHHARKNRVIPVYGHPRSKSSSPIRTIIKALLVPQKKCWHSVFCDKTFWPDCLCCVRGCSAMS